MSQLIVNSGQLPLTLGPKALATVSISDETLRNETPETPRPTGLWPVVAISLGGVATLAWSGFLIWHAARAVIGLVVEL